MGRVTIRYKPRVLMPDGEASFGVPRRPATLAMSSNRSSHPLRFPFSRFLENYFKE